MTLKPFALLALAAALTACGAAQAEIDEQFRTNFVESCVSTATGAGTPANVAQTVCSCSADKVLEEMGAVPNVPEEDANRILQQCITENGIALPG